MKYYLEKSSKDHNHSIVIRGKDATGRPYRIFAKFDGNVLRVDPATWIKKGDKDFDRDKYVRKNPVLNTFLKDLKRTLEKKVTENKLVSPLYSIPDAWKELYGKPKSQVERFSNKVIDAIDPYLRDNKGNKSAGYLRHFTQLKTEITVWNKDVCFHNLNEITLNSYLQYLKAEGVPVRKTSLKSSTIGHHFKHLRQVAKYVSQRGIHVDPMLFDFRPGRVVYELGCFDLMFEELMILWHYKPENKTEEVVLDYSLMEAFTGIRNGDLYSITPDGLEHGIKCGDISVEYIGYRDRKNDNILKSATRHKFNDHFIKKYLQNDPNEFLFPPITQQTINRVIKEIAAKAGLSRGIRRGNIIQPMHEVISSHCFRASYANLLYRLGVTSDMVSEELGHAPANVTIKHYLRFSNRGDIIQDKMNGLEIKAPIQTTSLRKAM